MDETFKTTGEKELSRRLLDIDERVETLQREREDVMTRLDDGGGLKRLLFEQGLALEEATLQAMRLLGFKASNYRDSESEFDAVLESPEGRIVGETEGKDRRPINIDKLRQLQSNLIEDLERDGVTDMATGMLFGNAYRLIPPSERSPDHFTAKVRQAAARSGIVLLRTSDLFDVARALADKPDDDFAADCRKAIFAAVGGEVEFPAIPSEDN